MGGQTFCSKLRYEHHRRTSKWESMTRAELRSAGPGSKLGELLNETAAWCSELSEVLDTALEEEDMTEIAEIRCVCVYACGLERVGFNWISPCDRPH
eukprot:1158268-Pelagomonas_calceolata.AAC.1